MSVCDRLSLTSIPLAVCLCARVFVSVARFTAVQTHRQRDSEVRDLGCKAEEPPLNKAVLPSAELQLY